MNYASIRPMDISNGEGIRVSLFVSGCYNNCKGCFNKEQQDFAYGKLYTQETENKILEYVGKQYIAGLSILGGDPMCQDVNGMRELAALCKKVKVMGKTVWLWTGFTWENLMIKSASALQSTQLDLIASCDIVVDGPFIETKKDLSLKFRGSSNQRIIDVKKSLDKNKIVLYN